MGLFAEALSVFSGFSPPQHLPVVLHGPQSHAPAALIRGKNAGCVHPSKLRGECVRVKSAALLLKKRIDCRCRQLREDCTLQRYSVRKQSVSGLSGEAPAAREL